MTNNVPMSWWNFHRYISSSQQQNDWIDNFYKLGFDGLVDKITSYDHALELLAYVFNDYADVINTWAYECNYGRDDNIVIICDNKEYKTEEDIYELVCKEFNKQVEWSDINIKRR